MQKPAHDQHPRSTPKPKVYDIDDILYGLNNFNKLKRLHAELKASVLPQDPISTSSLPLATRFDSGDIAGSYGWEIYSSGTTFIMLEYVWDWRVMGGFHPPHPASIQEARTLKNIRISIYPSNPAIEATLEAVIEKYPRTATGTNPPQRESGELITRGVE